MAFLISIGSTIPRFMPGIPMSVDTTSHLYRVVFLEQWMKRGVIPFWSPDWYGGSPAVLLYPPLSYCLPIGLSLLGVDPILSYKIADATFYVIAPLMVYLLGKELGFERGESAIGALFFSVTPQVVGNYLIFDRFPTIASIPIFCVFVIVLSRALYSQSRTGQYTIASVIAFSALLLTHHLSALIAGAVAVLIGLIAIGKCGIRKPILTLGWVAIGAFGLTAFWLMPFILSVRIFLTNPFYNRNVTFPFLRFTYFATDVAVSLLGIVQFALAAFATQKITRDFSESMILQPSAFFMALFCGMVLFEIGEVTPFALLAGIGQFIVILSFVVFMGQFVFSQHLRKFLAQREGVLLTVIWFFVFLWISLGYFALPLVWLPYVSQFWIKTMDVYRVWLYLTLPMCLLAGYGVRVLMDRIRVRTRSLAGAALLILILTPLTITVASNLTTFNAPVNNVLPYTVKNAEIPDSLINYFKSDNSSGRILGINVPLWIYVLPNYVNKPIVDGWYPQAKLIPALLNINDYRLDDLETAPNSEARVNTWKTLIGEADSLDITWIMIGGRGLASILMNGNSNFAEQAVFSYGTLDLLVFKVRSTPTYVEPGIASEVARPTPDEIIITFKPNIQKTERIIVKEAYYPTLSSIADGRPLVIERDNSSGYIMIDVPAGTRQLTLNYSKGNYAWNIVSLVSLLMCVGLGLNLRRNRRTDDYPIATEATSQL